MPPRRIRPNPRPFRHFLAHGALLVGVGLAARAPANEPRLKDDDGSPEAAAAASTTADLFDPPGAIEVAMAPPTELGEAASDDPLDFLADAAPARRAAVDLPRGARDGVFQKVVLESLWTPAMSSDQPDLVDVSAYAVFGLPAPTRRSPLLLTPGFGSHSLGGPTALDLPEQLYDAYFQVRWMSQLTERWGVNVAVTPGVYSDFEQTDGDAIRITGQLLASWDWTPNAKVIAGAVYLDRPDVAALPAAGLIWTPNDDWKLDFIAPRPKAARRLFDSADVEHWAYLAGEFAGGSWAVQRASGADDQLSYRAYHLLTGWERKHFGAVTGAVELGLAFGREFEYDAGGESFRPDESLLFRGRVEY